MSSTHLFDDATLAEWTQAIPRLLEAAHVPGLSVAVVREGRTAWSGAFGVRDAASRLAVDEGTSFAAASLSKPVFVCAVLLAVERGELDLDLDTPLRGYLAEPYVADDPSFDLITARMVLSHTTGLPNWREVPELRVLRRPGEAFGYSGEGYVYLQRVVEHLTGETAGDFVWRVVLRPLGMAASSYVWIPEYEASAAVGHDAAGVPMEIRKQEESNVAGSLRTTALEFVRLLSEMLVPEDKRVLLDQKLVDQMLAPHVRLAPRLEWGLGWGLMATEHGRSFWHWGDNPGNKAFTVGFPDSRAGVVFLTNGNGGREIYQELLRLALGERLPSADMLDSLGDYLV